MLDKDLVKKCVARYREGWSRTTITNMIMDHTGLKETAARKRAKIIWDNEFEEEYVPINQRSNSILEKSIEDVKELDDDFSSRKETHKFHQSSEDDAVAESQSLNIRTLEGLLTVCQVDLNKWEVDKHIVNKWEVAAKDSEGELKHSPLFQVKAWLKRKEVDKAKEVIEYFKNQVPTLKRSVQIKNSGGNYLYEISIPDLHLSKLCWSQETGHQDYDIRKAADMFKSAFYGLLDRVDISDIDKILLPIGNDFFNSEGKVKMTTNGTPQDDDTRWPKSFSVGCNLITDVLSDVSKNLNVDVVVVPGNHDFERSFYLGEFLRAWFRENEAVTIDNTPTPRKYYEFGNNLIMFTHGRDEKQKDLPLIMATENSSFSMCKHRTVHLGHLHQYSVREDKGVSVKVLPSLCPPDAWHTLKGYVNNKRAAMGFLYDPKYGEVANYFYNVED